jgi:hypothetical protein
MSGLGILQPSQRSGGGGGSTPHSGHQREYGPLLHCSSLGSGVEQSFRSGLAAAETGWKRSLRAGLAATG